MHRHKQHLSKGNWTGQLPTPTPIGDARNFVKVFRTLIYIYISSKSYFWLIFVHNIIFYMHNIIFHLKIFDWPPLNQYSYAIAPPTPFFYVLRDSLNYKDLNIFSQTSKRKKIPFLSVATIIGVYSVNNIEVET